MNELLDYGRAGRTLALPDIIDMHAHFGNWSCPEHSSAARAVVWVSAGAPCKWRVLGVRTF
jgi:hypothetical protein